MGIIYRNGGSEMLDEIKQMWESLNRYHAKKSQHFGGHFKDMTFEKRMKYLEKKEGVRASIIIVMDDSMEIKVGYCLATVFEGCGEIESLYVDKKYRGMKIGERLMTDSLKWINSHEVDNIVIGVAAGNETAFKFYEKFGFYPKVTKLGLKK